MPTSIGEIGTFRRRYLSEFIEQNLLLLICKLVDHDKDNHPIPKPFYSLKICVNDTGEIVELIDSHSYVMQMCTTLLEKLSSGEVDYPIAFRVITVSRGGRTVYEVTDWVGEKPE